MKKFLILIVLSFGIIIPGGMRVMLLDGGRATPPSIPEGVKKFRSAPLALPSPARGEGEDMETREKIPSPSTGEGRGKGDKWNFFHTFPLPKGPWWNFIARVSISWKNRSAYALPSYQEVRKAYVKSESLLLDRRGEVIHEIRTDRDRRRLDWTPLKDISPALKDAVVAAEDQRFFEHGGIDYRAMAASLFRGVTSAGLRGASTISMQLASLLDRDLRSLKGRRSVRQKLGQIFAARDLERSWSKDEILEAYLNLTSFRGELQGISAAARGLFGKDAHGLDRVESLLLAVLIRSPGASGERLSRRAVHLAGILGWPADGAEVFSRAKEVWAGPALPRPQVALAPHLARQLLKDQPGGTSLACTVDGEIQRFALDRLIHHLLPLRAQNVGQGALLVVDNRTGEVLAYVSYSREPSRGRFVDGVRAKRQAGSTLKPFLYALALEERVLTAASLLDDSPLDLPVFHGIYHPRNYESRFQGPVSVREALGSSLNVPAVRTLSLVGTERFLKKLRALGIKDLNEPGDFYGPALALGSADVSLWELVTAYRALANGGEWSELRLGPEGNRSRAAKRAFSREAAFLISDILSDREARSITFGLENSVATPFWTAVKTGTSKDMRDNWCVGYSPEFTVGVWVGNFSGEPMWNVSGITGAAPVWVEIMSRLHRTCCPPREKAPPGLVKAAVAPLREPGAGKEEWFLGGTQPLSQAGKTRSYTYRVVYPPPGTVVALDPDIPSELQKIFFIAQPAERGLRWSLNGKLMEPAGKETAWVPRPGKYRLALWDEEDRLLDCAYFEVRGPGAGPKDEKPPDSSIGRDDNFFSK